MTGGYHSDGTNWYGRLQYSGGNCGRRYTHLTSGDGCVDGRAQEQGLVNRKAETRKALADWAKADCAKPKADSDWAEVRNRVMSGDVTRLRSGETLRWR
jgi:hypothetical protein